MSQSTLSLVLFKPVCWTWPSGKKRYVRVIVTSQFHPLKPWWLFTSYFERSEVWILPAVNPNKQRKTHLIGLCTLTVFCFSYLIIIEAPASILAIILITRTPCFTKALEITFSQLSPTNYGRYDFQETEATQRSAVFVWPPGNQGIFFPCFVAVNAHNC